MTGRKPYVDDGTLGINLPPDQQRYDPFPVREWERCESCGHVGADCDDQCCWIDEPWCQCGRGHPADGKWCYLCELPARSEVQ